MTSQAKPRLKNRGANHQIVRRFLMSWDQLKWDQNKKHRQFYWNGVSVNGHFGAFCSGPVSTGPNSLENGELFDDWPLRFVGVA